MSPASAYPGDGPVLPADGATKQEWRRWARVMRRSGVPKPVSRAITAGIVVWLAGPDAPDGTVVLYLPLPDEVDLTAVVDSTERSFAITRTPARGPLTLHPADVPLERHRYGFEQPVAGAPRADHGDVGVVLVPGLAFDRGGGRLGRGGGYYDRFLPTLPRGAARVGVGPEQLVVNAVPTDPHDVPMTHLATERSVLRLLTTSHKPQATSHKPQATSYD